VAAEVNANFSAVEAAVDDNNNRIGDLETDTTALDGRVTTLEGAASAPSCAGEDATDIMVQVGSLCIDKYEASVWENPDGTGIQYGKLGETVDYTCPGIGGGGATTDCYPCAQDGSDCSVSGTQIYARSQIGVQPSVRITWYQALQACANVGKRLVTNDEWQAAAAGTDDSGATTCNISGTQVNTGASTGCDSSFAVSDMYGNVWEMVANTSFPATGSMDSASALARGNDYLNNTAIDQGIYSAFSGIDTRDAFPTIGFRCAR
jgi:hypothetical protein